MMKTLRILLLSALCCFQVYPVFAGQYFGWLAPTGCSTSATFLARTSGLSGVETLAYQIMICGMVADGTFGLLDALYIFATNTTTTANLNLVSTSFGITNVGGTPTFTADVGYTTSATVALNTNFLTGTQFTLNSASMGVAIQTNDTSSSVVFDMGATDGTHLAEMSANLSLQQVIELNDAGFSTGVATTSKGLWGGSRTGAGAVAFYGNGSSTPTFTSTLASTALLTTGTMFIGARNNSVGGIANPASRQYSAAWIGAGLTGAQFASISSRINTYLASMPTPVNVY